MLSSVGEKLVKIANADFDLILISAMEIPGFTGTHLDGGDLLATQMAPGDHVLIAGVAAQAEDQGGSLNRSEAARRRWRRKRLKQAMSGR